MKRLLKRGIDNYPSPPPERSLRRGQKCVVGTPGKVVTVDSWTVLVSLLSSRRDGGEPFPGGIRVEDRKTGEIAEETSYG